MNQQNPQVFKNEFSRHLLEVGVSFIGYRSLYIKPFRNEFFCPLPNLINHPNKPKRDWRKPRKSRHKGKRKRKKQQTGKEKGNKRDKKVYKNMIF